VTSTDITKPTSGAMFDIAVVDQLRPEHITKVAANVLGAVRIRGFFTSAECADIMSGLEGCELGAYDEQFVQPRVAKLGPAAYDFYGGVGLTDEYWAAAQSAEQVRSTLLPGRDLMEMARSRLAAGWGGDIRIATSNGRRLFSGMIREINYGAKPHFDEVVREFPGVLDCEPVCQLAFNCYLAMPPASGESVVFRRRWTPADEEHRDTYGYAQSLLAGRPAAEVRAEQGDAVLFDCRNYHLVRPNSGGGRRVTLSFFIGLQPATWLQVWS
jgi:hypothetical protein